MPRQFQAFPYQERTASQEMILRWSSQIYRKALIISAQHKYDTTFPGYGKDQYAREALVYLSNDQLWEYIHTEEPSFSFNFVLTIIYMQSLLIDPEILSAFIIAEKAIQIEQDIEEKIKLINSMKTDHYRKYGTFFEKIKSYILN